MGDMKQESFYPRVFAYMKRRVLRQSDQFQLINVNEFFPVHGYTESQKLAAFEEIVRRHNQFNLDNKEFTRADTPWVNDLIRYVGQEGGAQSQRKSVHQSGNLVNTEYKLKQLEGTQGLTDPTEGNELLFLAPHIIGVDTGTFVLPNWLDSLNRTKNKSLFSIYANELATRFVRDQEHALRSTRKVDRPLHQTRIEAWDNFFRIYIRQASGRVAYIPDRVQENQSFQIGKVALAFSDNNSIVKILADDQDIFLETYDIKLSLIHI